MKKNSKRKYGRKKYGQALKYQPRTYWIFHQFLKYAQPTTVLPIFVNMRKVELAVDSEWPPCHTKNLLREFLKDRQNNYIDFFDDESFDTYIRCARDACNAVPKHQFSKNCFKMFAVNPKHIPKNEIIYPIPN